MPANKFVVPKNTFISWPNLCLLFNEKEKFPLFLLSKVYLLFNF